MGLLSSILTVGGAAAGFALGGPAGASLGMSLGGAVGGGIDQNKAVKKATAAEVQAQAQALQARKDAAAKVSALQAPGVAAYGSGLNALTGRLGIQPVPPPAAAPPPQTPRQPVSWDALGGDTGGQGYVGKTPGGFAGVSPIEMSKGADGTYAAAPPSSVTATQPAPTNALSGGATAMGQGVDPGTYGSTDNPTAPASYQGPGTYTAPAAFKYGAADYTASPGYQYQQDQARQGILASASATGALQSGAALKELQDRAQKIAYNDFTGERAFAAGRYDTSNNNALTAFNTNATNGLNTYNTNRNAYADDRNYRSNRFDNQTNNLFNYTGIGQQAAGIVGNAELGVGQAGASAALGTGNALSQAAVQRGVISGNVLSGAVGLGTSFLNGQAGKSNALSGYLQGAASQNPYLF